MCTPCLFRLVGTAVPLPSNDFHRSQGTPLCFKSLLLNPCTLLTLMTIFFPLSSCIAPNSIIRVCKVYSHTYLNVCKFRPRKLSSKCLIWNCTPLISILLLASNISHWVVWPLGDHPNYRFFSRLLTTWWEISDNDEIAENRKIHNQKNILVNVNCIKNNQVKVYEYSLCTRFFCLSWLIKQFFWKKTNKHMYLTISS